jgi:phosphatidylglycerophosphate synthase
MNAIMSPSSQSDAPDTGEVDVDALMAQMSDAPNRVYRYRVARWLLPLAMRTPATPNQITFLHACMGIASGYFIARGSYQDLAIAFVLAELRMIFDCLDGVVARAKKLFSPTGRAVDEAGDAVGFCSMMAGTGVHLWSRLSPLWAVALPCAAVAGAAFSAVVYDFYKRKFNSALTAKTDGVVDELVKKRVEYARNDRTFFKWFGIFFDSIQIFLLAQRVRPVIEARVAKQLAGESTGDDDVHLSEEVLAIRSAARAPGFSSLLRRMSWVTGDNAISIFNFGLLSGSVALAAKVSAVYGLAMILLGALWAQRFLRQAVAARASSANPSISQGLAR